MPKISVIIPVYNVENYLQDCLSSVCNQNFRDIEIICINDGSTDGSLQILENFAKNDKRIKIINQQNQGQAIARNKGLQATNAEFITFLDSDDKYASNEVFKKAIKYFDDKDIDFVDFKSNIFGINDKNLLLKYQRYHNTKFSQKVKINTYVSLNSIINVWNKIYRKSIIEENKIYFADGLYFEDAAWSLMYFSMSKFAYFMNEKFYDYRLREGSTMDLERKNPNKFLFHRIKNVEILYEFFKKNNKLKEQRFVIESYFRSCLYAQKTLSYQNFSKVLEFASKVANKFDDKIFSDCFLIGFLKEKKYYLIPGIKYKSPLFLFKKYYDNRPKFSQKHIIFNICGFKIKLKQKFDFNEV